LYALQTGQAGVDAETGTMQIPVRTFEDVIHRLLVHKRAGMEHMSLLGDDTESDDVGRPVTPRASSRSTRGAMKALSRKKRLDAAKAEKAAKAKQGLWGALSNSLFGAAPAAGSEASAVAGAKVVAPAEAAVEVGGDGAALELSAGADGDSEGQEDGVEEEEDDTIHVFSLATGHMYERLVRSKQYSLFHLCVERLSRCEHLVVPG
jgi:hypothetical protein